MRAPMQEAEQVDLNQIRVVLFANTMKLASEGQLCSLLVILVFIVAHAVLCFGCQADNEGSPTSGCC